MTSKTASSLLFGPQHSQTGLLSSLHKNGSNGHHHHHSQDSAGSFVPPADDEVERRLNEILVCVALESIERI